jgi:hypothetical protein
MDETTERFIRETVANLLLAGVIYAWEDDYRRSNGLAEFQQECGQRGISYPEALLLARWAADRPTWANPAAVDLSDPLVVEVWGIHRRLCARSLRMPPEGLNCSEAG